MNVPDRTQAGPAGSERGALARQPSGSRAGSGGGQPPTPEAAPAESPTSDSCHSDCDRRKRSSNEFLAFPVFDEEVVAVGELGDVSPAA